MKAFLIVYHHYWMSDKGFEHELYYGKTKNEAYDKASSIAYQKSSTFNHVDCTIIELTRNTRTVALTLQERITGKINNTVTTGQLLIDKENQG